MEFFGSEEGILWKNFCVILFGQVVAGFWENLTFTHMQLQRGTGTCTPHALQRDFWFHAYSAFLCFHRCS